MSRTFVADDCRISKKILDFREEIEKLVTLIYNFRSNHKDFPKKNGNFLNSKRSHRKKKEDFLKKIAKFISLSEHFRRFNSTQKQNILFR